MHHTTMAILFLALFSGEKTVRKPAKKGVTKMSQNRFCKYIKSVARRSNLHTSIQPSSHRYHAIRKKKQVKNLLSLKNNDIFLLRGLP